MTTRPRIRVPETIKSGDVIEIKTLISHVMETGNRKDVDGKLVPRNIINSFTAAFEGQVVFQAELNSGISANPFLVFHLKVPGPGQLDCTWIDDAGIKIVESLKLDVT